MHTHSAIPRHIVETEERVRGEPHGEDAPEEDVDEEQVEVPVVEEAHGVEHPGAVVVVVQHTSAEDGAVVGAGRLDCAALPSG
jgi:hypothetical protein